MEDDGAPKGNNKHRGSGTCEGRSSDMYACFYVCILEALSSSMFYDEVSMSSWCCI